MVPRNHMVIRVAEDGTEWSAELRKYFHGVTSQRSVSVPVLFRPVFRGFTRTRRTTGGVLFFFACVSAFFFL